MKNLIRRDLARWLCHRVQLAWVVVVVLSLVSTCVAGCGDSPSEVSGIASPTIEAGMVEPPVPVTLTPTTPAPKTSLDATSTPTTPPPTAVVPPPLPPTPDPTAVVPPPPTTSGFVLEHPDIPSEIEERILENKYWPINVLPSGEASESEPYVGKINCEKPGSITYVQNLIVQATLGEASNLDNAIVESIGRHSWRVPWKTGFLQFGYPKVIDPCQVEIRGGSRGSTVWWFPSLHGEPYLLMRVSGDGNSWNDPVHLSVPFTISPLRVYGGEVYAPQISAVSNGDYLLLVTGDASGIKTFTSTDLDKWSQLAIPFHRPNNLHSLLGTSFGLEEVVLGPNGWLARAVLVAFIDPYRMAPSDIKEEAAWVEVDPWAFCQDGIELYWRTRDSTQDSQCVTWDELGMDEDTFWLYASEYGNKPYHQSPNFSGWVWSQEWESTIPSESSNGWVELPYIPLKLCCDIIGTQEGYMALTIPFFAGYDPHRSGEQRIYFSHDGYEWVPIETPESVHSNDWHEQGDTPFTFIWSIRSRESDVLVSGHWYSFSDYQGDPIMWIIDPNGTNWREVDPADLAD